MTKALALVLSHSVVAVVGFAAGIYVLPILTAPESAATAELQSLEASALFTGQFRRDLRGSDFLHWGDGIVAVGQTSVSLRGKLAPGPDYKAYLSPEYVETEAEFQAVKSRAVRLGDVRAFKNFVVGVPPQHRRREVQHRRHLVRNLCSVHHRRTISMTLASAATIWGSVPGSL